ncbi:CDP-alcohol phosphatidyltransferase family protein [Streptomyces caeruleatus]|uniref:CDP-alcohol phosphatidyltransferase n=1 Tax=Streptomyces caeruleatus TaxID=661399 RepID=A0A101TVB1_9ACTN|nr:CDP-alcohol phosphatidyltransferase family protein [Streptomyces caeruleatus]KUN99138.1 CDP-alcohol phosphatidyltransferase [Streptomyces caeruleatus]
MDFPSTVRQLSKAQKPARGVPGYSRFVNRPAGRLLAAAAHRIGLSPNHVTAASGLVTFPAIAAIALHPPTPALGAWVTLALLVGFALDSADGQLARLHGSAGPAGAWMDHVVDCAKLLSVHAAVLISFYRFFDLPHPVVLLVPITFQFAAVLLFFGGMLTEQLRRRATDAQVAPVRQASTVRGIALLPVDYGLLCLLFLFLGHEDLFLAVYAALLAAHLVLVPAFFVKWFRELS